jgi:hypothetical protein
MAAEYSPARLTAARNRPRFLGNKTGGERRRATTMYIGIGAVVAIILIIILLAFVF